MSFLPLHSHSNRRDRAVTLTETGGLMSCHYPEVTMEITTKRGSHLDTRPVGKIIISPVALGNHVTRWRVRDIKDLQPEKTLNFSEYEMS